ncbi:hypothetical protein [Roseibium sp. RKSG952]|uniref:hypothetical protein n=1 Tax=Roseibium sp. RKSG952 TaxID=2529384 RepID=UPI0012BB52C6|nr:hypothetical protein [Roseibium sp. RKSG952]MTH98074.1 hypothetical protein [Roseibium sp. RKSG952]
MSRPDVRDEEREEPPLDPASQRIQVKLRRLLLGSSLIMFVGFIAVFAAIFYKINSGGPEAAIEFPSSIAVTAGGEVTQMATGNGVILFVVKGTDGADSLVRVDAESGAILSRTSI